MSIDAVMTERMNTRLGKMAEMLCLVVPDADIGDELAPELKADSIINALHVFLPEEFSLAEIADACKKHKRTVHNHLASNYLEGVHYRLTEKGGKIYVARDAALSIRRHYAK
jgi:hypothetical protein